MLPCGLARIRQFLTPFVLGTSVAWCGTPVVSPSVAVLDFQPRGVSRAFADSVADRLGRALRETGRYRVMERDSVSRRRDHGRGGGLVARCGEWGCAIRAGRVLEVDRTLIGAIDAEGTALRLSLRMLDIGRELPLEKREFLTDRGSDDLLGRGCASLAAAYAAQEPGLAPTAAPDAGGVSSDRLRIAKLEKERSLFRRIAGASAIAGGVALLIGGSLFVGNSVGCAFSGEGPCKEPDRTPEQIWLASGVLLEGVALATGIAAIGRSRELRERQSKIPSGVSWGPFWEPATGAMGLATRVEF